MLENIGFDVTERGVWSVFEAVSESRQDLVLEVWTRVRPDHSLTLFIGDRVSWCVSPFVVGVQVPFQCAETEAGSCDTVLITGGEALVNPQQDPQLLTAVETLSAPAQRVASVCTGAFVLAALGYLDGRRATTHWRHAHQLARWHPDILVEPDVIHVRDGRYLTSAGVTAGIDMALILVEDDLGVDVARNVARELVMFSARAGKVSNERAATRGDGVRRGRSCRGAYREIGTSPARWLEQIRVDAA